MNCQFLQDKRALIAKFCEKEFESLAFLLGAYMPLSGLDLAPFRGLPRDGELADFSAKVIALLEADLTLTSEQRSRYIRECWDPVSNRWFGKLVIPGTRIGLVDAEDLLRVMNAIRTRTSGIEG